MIPPSLVNGVRIPSPQLQPPPPSLPSKLTMSDWAQYNLPGTAIDLEVPANNVFPAELGGVFSGITQNLWGDTTPYEVRYTFPENGGCNMWGDECAIGEYLRRSF